MQAAALDYYLQHDNCFPCIANWTQAQRLMDSQLKTKWPKLLNAIARQLNPIHAEIFRRRPASYYWSTYQHEWASMSSSTRPPTYGASIPAGSMP